MAKWLWTCDSNQTEDEKPNQTEDEKPNQTEDAKQ